MKELKNIIDTWNMVEKYNIVYYIDENDNVCVSDGDFQKMLDGSKNKTYIKNLLASNGRLYSHEFI